MIIDDKISTINDNDNSENNQNMQNASNNENNPNQKEMKYKNLDDDFNLVSLKTRYMLQKINSLMEEKKDEEINLEDFNNSKNSEYKNQIMKKKIIQYYCTNKNDKALYIPPSEKIIKKIRQFKKWQKYEIYQKDGFKNYLNNLMPDYKDVHNTKKVIDDKINLVTKINLKPTNNNNNSINILPKINNNYSRIEKENESNNIFNDISKFYQKRLIKNASMDDIIKNNSSISKINQNTINSSRFNQNSMSFKPKNKRKNSTMNNNRSSSLIKNLDNSKKIDEKNNSKELKVFEKSIFCLNKSLVPMSIDKSVVTTPFGGGLLHCNSLLRNKNINNLVPYYSSKKIQEKLDHYRRERNKIIHNKDYMYPIDNTFITNNRKNYNYYDYLIF